MLITFKSPAAPDVVMLENLAQFLLGLIGKRLGQRGVIAQDEMGAAITRLEAAIVNEKAIHDEQTVNLHPGHESEHEDSAVGLRQRAFPLLDMMRAAQREGTHIVWGL